MGKLAVRNGWGDRAQLKSQGFPDDYAVAEHGGFIMDCYVMAPLTAYLMSVYRMKYVSVWSLVFLVGIIISFYFLGRLYNRMSIIRSDGFSVGGRMTTVGWLHGVFALPVAWVLFMVYFGQTEPGISQRDLLITSLFLTMFFPVGLMKFAPHWKWTRQDAIQAGSCIAVVWIVTAIKLAMA